MSWSESLPACDRRGVLLPLLAGLGTGLSLIVAIGAQNAFVLRQGLRRDHVVLVVAVCAVSDLVLILLGVAGIGVLVERAPVAVELVRWGGAAFLAVYGLLAARRALRGGSLEADPAGRRLSWQAALATCLAFTWLNPHVYLDTVLLVGSVASTHGTEGRWWFGGGAAAASVLWFSALGAGARLLTPVFRRPAAWRGLDGLIAAVMLGLAVLLLVG
jgi:L-lysine exporter family protein LysE/ArgO